MIFQYHTKVNDYITTFLPEIILNLTPSWQTCEPCIWVLILSGRKDDQQYKCTL